MFQNNINFSIAFYKIFISSTIIIMRLIIPLQHYVYYSWKLTNNCKITPFFGSRCNSTRNEVISKWTKLFECNPNLLLNDSNYS